jgi:hypothetical protein
MYFTTCHACGQGVIAAQSCVICGAWFGFEDGVQERGSVVVDTPVMEEAAAQIQNHMDSGVKSAHFTVSRIKTEEIVKTLSDLGYKVVSVGHVIEVELEEASP